MRQNDGGDNFGQLLDASGSCHRWVRRTKPVRL